jgi:hypothetical protein
MFEEFFDAIILVLIAFVYAGVRRMYGWRGTLIAFAPIALVFGLAGAEWLGWLSLFDANEMLKAACWWLGLGAFGTAYGVFEARREHRRRD